MKDKNYFIITSFVVILAVASLLPILKNVPQHPDEHQFFLNAFAIMGEKPLHNYLHVALTEYVLAFFLTIINLFTPSGVNFPQGDPSNVTYFYGRVLGVGLLLLTYVLGYLIISGKKLKFNLKLFLYTALYFSSIGILERNLRINSDNVAVIVFFIYLLLTFRFIENKATSVKYFIITSFFLFLGTFTNLKFLYLSLPLVLLNSFNICLSLYKQEKESTSFLIFKIISAFSGIALAVVLLWGFFMPKPFDNFRFWYGVKKTITHGTQYDFDYPSQSFESWKFYIYDLFVEYTGLLVFVLLIALLIHIKKDVLFKSIRDFSLKCNLYQIYNLWNNNIYSYTFVLLFLSLFSYYIGVSTAVVHWSRWGYPLGVIAVMLLAYVLDYLIKLLNISYFSKTTNLIIFLLIISLQRNILVYDIFHNNYPEMFGSRSTVKAIDGFFKQKGITVDPSSNDVVWFTGYTFNVKSMSVDHIFDLKENKVKYLLWPYWNIGPVYSEKYVDLGTHNQVEFVKKYTTYDSTIFPSLTSYYMHVTKLFAWKVLNITWNPEIDSLVPSQVAVLKPNIPEDGVSLSYDVDYDSMSHYFFADSYIFNLNNMKDSYMFPPCYAYPDSIKAKDGTPNPPVKDNGGRTPGLHCHSIRFRIFFKGEYKFIFEGLPEDVDGTQIIYSNLAGYVWNPETKTITYTNKETMIPGEFGVATKKKYIPNLKIRVLYKGNL